MPNDKVESELAGWISGEEIVRHTDAHGTVRVVTRGPNGYSLLRGFPMGEGAGISADLQDVTAERLIGRLLRDGGRNG